MNALRARNNNGLCENKKSDNLRTYYWGANPDTQSDIIYTRIYLIPKKVFRQTPIKFYTVNIHFGVQARML